jgi:class 3 adenylate cyclase
VSGHKKELGVTAFGHRRKLLDAIAALPSDTSAVESPAKIRRVSAESRAERRQVTVMFSELVGSTALSARMDPKTSAKSSRPTTSPSQRRCRA